MDCSLPPPPPPALMDDRVVVVVVGWEGQDRRGGVLKCPPKWCHWWNLR